ncbi:hypothetical protein [Planctomyces sp. SH-PL62]|uniref:hypothetical protein n=1 Tax=Planctomyces sp. SH-PL62 TaxID=1636152 RepID=UPI000837E045|nr:hypothetical protein [Planctomyces sp. SH-PL62]
MTVSQVCKVFARLLRIPASDPERIAAEVSRVLWRKAEGGGADLPLAQGHRRLSAAPAATGYQLIR